MATKTTVERLATIETQIKAMAKDVSDLKIMIPKTMDKLENFLTEIVGRFVPIEIYQEGRKSIEKDVKDMDDRLDELEKKWAIALAVMTIVAPIIYFILEKVLGRFF